MQWFSIAVTGVAAFVFGLLAHRSSKKDWEFIKAWPSLFLFLLSMAAAQGEWAQRKVDQLLPPLHFVCEWITDDQGMPVQDCGMKAEPGGPPESSVKFIGAWLWTSFLSMILDVPLELIGINLGIMTAKSMGGAQQTM